MEFLLNRVNGILMPGGDAEWLFKYKLKKNNYLKLLFKTVYGRIKHQEKVFQISLL